VLRPGKAIGNVPPTAWGEETDVAEETWLSEEAYARLKAELDELRTTGLERMSRIIGEARAHGDLRENAEYDAAKNEQGRMEARIRQLQALLRDARIGEPQDTDEVRQGLVVVLDIAGDEETYLVGSREDEHPELDILSASSPMGEAVLGAKVGDEVTFDTPTGTTLAVTVQAIRQP
jgi:transcription elongation factor GreA